MFIASPISSSTLSSITLPSSILKSPVLPFSNSTFSSSLISPRVKTPGIKVIGSLVKIHIPPSFSASSLSLGVPAYMNSGSKAKLTLKISGWANIGTFLFISLRIPRRPPV
ncbi:110aa long hypothetical protein [Pyrococcus horikoshii OT3]|uniref:Uncharacterized protein n=1 Tax=Pyrococcus horikoshii (strain ATCC 700860 / DSM 12428 / JCM 9974 / NBRC 100139 / OT-3) TaxID=70601 RepID=O58605_PYRHO|nr:110aa long hypothetical protein [Pyrococcus horikoshii OT3]